MTMQQALVPTGKCGVGPCALSDLQTASAEEHLAKDPRRVHPQDASVAACLQGHELHDHAESTGSHEGASQGPHSLTVI